jgi:hypothetical protein
MYPNWPIFTKKLIWPLCQRRAKGYLRKIGPIEKAGFAVFV